MDRLRAEGAHGWVLLPLGATLQVLSAPYDVSEAVTWAPGRQKPGYVLLVRVETRSVNVPELHAAVRELEVAHPAAPVVVVIALDPVDGFALASRLAPLGFRAVLTGGAGSNDALRAALTDPAALPARVAPWLRGHGLEVPETTAEMLATIIEAAPDHGTLTELLAAIGLSDTTAGLRLRKRGLPCPARWYQAARALHAALRLQRDPRLSIEDVAIRMGYADHSAVSQLLRRSLGVQPTEARRLLGWEPLLDRWVRRRVREEAAIR